MVGKDETAKAEDYEKTGFVLICLVESALRADSVEPEALHYTKLGHYELRFRPWGRAS
jgi:hypothetical protein